MAMPSQNRILNAMQFDGFRASNPIGSDAPASATVLNYSFHTSGATFDGGSYSGWTSFTASEKTMVRAAFAHLETFLNVRFVETTDNADADIELGLVNLPGSYIGYGGVSYLSSYGNITDIDGFAVFEKAYNLISNVDSVILHELGHALGLDHPFDGASLPNAYENKKYTLMSYTANPDTGKASDAMGLFDVFALQNIWGAAAYNTGNTTYTGSRTATTDTIWDSAGIDTFDASSHSNNVYLDLRPAHFSKFGRYSDVVIAFGVDIENAVGGSGNDKILGNDLSNILSGRSGSDLLRGFAGNDTLNGGNGKDTIRGGRGDDTLSGGAGFDRLFGRNGDDTLIADAGRTIMRGNAGADLFVFQAGRAVIEDFQDNYDRIQISGFGDLDDIRDVATFQRGNVVLQFDSDTKLVIKGVTVSDLMDGDLIT